MRMSAPVSPPFAVGRVVPTVIVRWSPVTFGFVTVPVTWPAVAGAV